MDFEILKILNCNQGSIRAVRFNVDGEYCLTCGADHKIKLWNPHKGLALKTYGGHGDEVLDARGSCDSSQIASCGADKLVILWDVSTGQSVRRLRGHASKVTCISYNELGTVAISGSQDNTVMCWDTRSRRNEPIDIFKDATDSITSVQVTNNEILTSSVDCRIRRYDIRTGSLFTDYVGDPVTCVSFTRDGQCMVTSCADNSVKLFDKDTGELLGHYQGHESGDFRIESCVDCSDKHILSGSVSGEIWCWDLVTEKVIDKLVHNKKAVVHSLCYHPTQQFLLSAAGKDVMLWGKQSNNENESV